MAALLPSWKNTTTRQTILVNSDWRQYSPERAVFIIAQAAVSLFSSSYLFTQRWDYQEKEQVEVENSKPKLGVGGMILGAIGVVVCVALIIGVWVLSSRLSDRTAQVFGVVESGLALADEQVGRVNGAIQDLQTGFQGRVEDIDPEAMLSQLDDLAGLVDATESTANTAGSAIRFASAMMAGGMTDEVAADVDELATNLETMSLDLEGVQDNVLAYLEGRADDGVTAQINTAVDDLLVRVETVDSLIDNTSSRANEIQQNMLGWISMAKWVLILLFLWIGAEQVLLFAHGWVSFAARKQS